MWSVEAQHDPFLPLVIAAGSTSRMRLGTNIAVAFARNPMTVAQVASDLHRMSQGRFILGLGPQVRAHIERRFAMPWSRPVARMREFVLALRAIWASWESGEPLCFEGEFYRHTLMAPNFDPGPTGHGPPAVYLAAVGPRMTAAAGEVADGLLCHPLATPAYLSAVTLPALGSAPDFVVVASVLAATGADEAALTASRENVRRKIAFYAATPAYRPILELHGLLELQPELNELARRGRWDEMAGRVDDAVLERFAVVGRPGDIGRAVRERFAGLADRVTIYELDGAGRLLLEGRYLAEPGPLRELMAGFNGG
jgi:probable F420-dependent oxidoreductase